MKDGGKKSDKGSKTMAKRDSKLGLQKSKIAPKKNMTGGNMPDKMYLPKNTPAAKTAAPAPKQKIKYKAPKSKQVFGNVNKMNRRTKSVKKCR